MAKGNVKYVGITACAQGYQCNANPTCLDSVGPPWGPWLGKLRPLASLEPVSAFKEDKSRTGKSRTLQS